MSTSILPNEQYMAALAKANEIRVFRAQLKRDMKCGRVNARGVLACPPQMTQTMCVFDVLMAMPKVGRSKANAMLRRAGVSPSRTLAELSDRQRSELLTLISRSAT